MSKVQKAIQTFGQPLVTVEGHTDSIGSTEVNQRLSLERAEAVRAYLVANQTLPASRISASGYGPDRPLASNATPEGRAVNRRIDVLITPAQKP
jgi:outer membrane protein OmpA-like peptidoglycan-associated protein